MVCCKAVVSEPSRQGPGGTVCLRPIIRKLITEGPSAQEYGKEKWRLKKAPPKDDCYTGCSPSQRRVILYGVLQKLLFPHESRRVVLPSCIKQAVREAQHE